MGCGRAGRDGQTEETLDERRGTSQRSHTSGTLLQNVTGVVFTSLLRGDHQGLGRLPPALPRLRRDAEHVDGLRLEVGHRVLASARAQHVHRGRVAGGGVEVVRDLVRWGEESEESHRRKSLGG